MLEKYTNGGYLNMLEAYKGYCGDIIEECDLGEEHDIMSATLIGATILIRERGYVDRVAAYEDPLLAKENHARISEAINEGTVNDGNMADHVSEAKHNDLYSISKENGYAARGIKILTITHAKRVGNTLILDIEYVGQPTLIVYGSGTKAQEALDEIRAVRKEIVGLICENAFIFAQDFDDMSVDFVIRPSKECLYVYDNSIKHLGYALDATKVHARGTVVRYDNLFALCARDVELAEELRVNIVEFLKAHTLT